jgi:hypothetical protein
MVLINETAKLESWRFLYIVQDLPKFLGFPKDLSENPIVVRQNRKLCDDELFRDENEIYFFLAVMGG